MGYSEREERQALVRPAAVERSSPDLHLEQLHPTDLLAYTRAVPEDDAGKDAETRCRRPAVVKDVRADVAACPRPGMTGFSAWHEGRRRGCREQAERDGGASAPRVSYEWRRKLDLESLFGHRSEGLARHRQPSRLRHH